MTPQDIEMLVGGMAFLVYLAMLCGPAIMFGPTWLGSLPRKRAEMKSELRKKHLYQKFWHYFDQETARKWTGKVFEYMDVTVTEAEFLKRLERAYKWKDDKGGYTGKWSEWRQGFFNHFRTKDSRIISHEL